MEEQEREQNKRINQHSRQISDLQQRIKTIELDVEPRGRISASFEAIEDDLDKIKSRITRLEQTSEHRFNRLDAKLEAILEHLIGVSNLQQRLICKRQ